MYVGTMIPRWRIDQTSLVTLRLFALSEVV